MAIIETVTVEVANVEVSDEYRVSLKQWRKVTDYTPDQADELATALRLRALEARMMLADHIAADTARILAHDQGVAL